MSRWGYPHKGTHDQEDTMCTICNHIARFGTTHDTTCPLDVKNVTWVTGSTYKEEN